MTWTLQNIFIADATGSIPVKIGNNREVGETEAGTVFYFVAAKKPSGALMGLKVGTDRSIEGGKTNEWKVLEVARSAEILTEEEWQKRNAPAAPPHPQTPAPAPAPIPVPATVPEPVIHPTERPAAPQPVSVDSPAGKQSMEKLEAVLNNQGAGNHWIKEIRLEKTVNTGNYCSEKLGLAIELGPEDDAEAAFRTAEQFIKSHLPPEVVPSTARRV